MSKKTKKPTELRARVLQGRFSEAITIAGRAVPKRSTLPIISSLLLESERGRLKVIATDLQTRVTAWVGAQIEIDGGVVVPAAAIKKMVSLMPDEALSLAATIGGIDEPSTLEIKSAKRTVALNGYNPDDFPVAAEFGDDRFTIEPDTLALALDRTLFATCNKDGRPVLYGVHFTTTGHHLRMEAADGFRLSVVEVPIMMRPGATPKACSIDTIVPADTLAHLRRVLPRKASETRHDVSLALRANEGAAASHLRFSLPNYDVSGQLIEGVFPEVKNLLPSPADLTTFGVEALINEVEAAVEVVKDTNRRVEFYTDPKANTLRVFSKAEGTGTFEGTIDATGGHGARIAMDGRYVLEALRAMHTTFATIGIESPEKPAMLRPSEGGGFYHIIMPMFVSESDWHAETPK